MWLQVINKVKVTHQGQIEVVFKERCFYAGGLHLNQMRSSSAKIFRDSFVLLVSTINLSQDRDSFPLPFADNGGVSCNQVNTCDVNADCIYDPATGTYVCRCRGGYQGDGYVCQLFGKFISQTLTEY